ncbi:serine hydrolase [Spongiactinospora gelatinilytica]|uniref:serine hydrolase n=1 Tax=Spongiactinospora gelatinilytica TaxID=2666298 RepID=UPI0034D2AC1A
MKSFPSSILQDRPDNSQAPLREAATLMISISDNTATDLLTHKAAPGTATPANFFTLKGAAPHLAASYNPPPPSRRTLLTKTLAIINSWPPQPPHHRINRFRPRICQAHATLTHLNDPPSTRSCPPTTPASTSPPQWPTVWSKGGSEPGLLTLSYSTHAKSRKPMPSSPPPPTPRCLHPRRKGRVISQVAIKRL